MWNEKQKEKRILVTSATEQYLGKMSNVVLCHLLRVFNISSGKQKKLYKGSQGEDGTLIKVSCLFLSSLFLFFQLFWMQLRAEKMKYKSEHSNFFFPCSILSPLSCCCFLLPPSLRAGKIFELHQTKRGKSQWMLKSSCNFSLSCFWRETQAHAVKASTTAPVSVRRLFSPFTLILYFLLQRAHSVFLAYFCQDF